MKEENHASIRGFIFDMDGTLFDTERLYRRFWFELGKEHGYYVDDHMLDLMRGASVQVGVKVFHDYNPDVDYFAERKERYARVMQYVTEHGAPQKPGLVPMLTALKACGYKLGIGSSTMKTQVDAYLASAGITDIFDFIGTGEITTHGKPEPDIFLIVAEKLGRAPETCVVVEDSLNGIRAGHAAGCHVIGIPDLLDLTPVASLCDTILPSLREIPAWAASQM